MLTNVHVSLNESEKILFALNHNLSLPLDLTARAILIDMEPKVINQTIAKAAKSGKWRYGDKAHFCQKQGSGNNWANG